MEPEADKTKPSTIGIVVGKVTRKVRWKKKADSSKGESSRANTKSGCDHFTLKTWGKPEWAIPSS